jgi:outer membrane receptor protein involved in Fe transport
MRVLLVLTALGSLALVPPSLAGDPAEEPVLTEQVTVTASRLPDAPNDADRVPANVSVISREEIAQHGSVDLADLLALQTGAVFYDQTGNAVQTTFDLRGFTDGSGTRVYLDGAPVNDAVNNTLSLELVPLEALERVEITRGSAAALAGGGSEAGVINLVTRRGEQLDGMLSLARGTHDSSEYGGFLSHDAGLVDFLVSARRRETDGFRDNADGDLRRLSAVVGVDLGGERRLSLTALDARSDYGTPGALTAIELRQDPSASPYNALDFADERLRLASVSYRGPLAPSLTVAANLFARDRETASLSTGRAAAAGLGGFALDADASFWGSTVQITHRHREPSSENLLTFGGEWLDGDTDALGFGTPPGDPGVIPPTETTSDRRTYALFVQDTWNPARNWTLLAGARYDRDRVGMGESLPDPSYDDSRHFSELSLRGGATWSFVSALALYASYGEGFLPPTSEELFAYPGFGSNPDLDPEDSRSYEVGLRGRWANGRAFDVGWFRIDTDDEIVFDPDSPVGPWGANVNAGETRRQGVETSLRGRVLSVVAFHAKATITDAEFTDGEYEGNDVPLVPRERFSLGLDLDLPAGLTLHTDGIYVGEQVLDNDDGNEQPKLDDYVVVNARLAWRLAEVTSPKNGLRLFVETRNVFDEAYATRGIYAYDFLSGTFDVFLTPAPGRRHLLGAEWDF